jgi:hypothetical protein
MGARVLCNETSTNLDAADLPGDFDLIVYISIAPLKCVCTVVIDFLNRSSAPLPGLEKALHRITNLVSASLANLRQQDLVNKSGMVTVSGVIICESDLNLFG